ncbi:MAG: MBOAT family O-acyltransferase [Thermodesulfobacteriota bacterium]
MIFSSVTFLFLFLPLVLAGSFLGGKRYRNHILFAASLLFYLWGEGAFVLLLLSSIVATFFAGRWLEKSSAGRRKLILALGVMMNLLPLFIFKYLHFSLDALSPLFAFAGLAPWQMESIHLPAGISFFTFQAISYLVDVYRRITPAEQRLLGCGLYISMFPQLIAGPIVRYHDIADQLVRRTVTVPKFARGVERFVFGLAKKVLLADPLGVQADRIFSLPVQDLSTPESWLGAICFSLQIYYDFSGYSDMAIGLGRMFGFRLPENFNYPYISRSMREFWHRWHISLSTWLRDYLYIPLGGNRRGRGRTHLNLLLVFLLCGLWHGANWTFILWGVWHGLFLALERSLPFRQSSLLTQGLGWLYTTLAVLIGWVLFRSPDVASCFDYLQVMFNWQGGPVGHLFTSLADDRLFLTSFVVGIFLALPLYKALCRLAVLIRGADWSASVLLLWEGGAALGRLSLFTALLYFVLVTIAARAYHPFLYFQF